MTEGVTDLVRGTLCPALKALFEHGLKKPSLLGGACHPWLFIEEVNRCLDPRSRLSCSLSPALGPVWPRSSWGGSVYWVGSCGFDLVPILVSLILTLTPRQQAGRWRETLTRCIHAWCCVRRTGNCPASSWQGLPAAPTECGGGCGGWGGGHSLGPAGRHSSSSSLRLDEDGKVLTPEELLYRVSGGGWGGPPGLAGGAT